MRNHKLLPLAALVLALVAVSPAAYASTLTITLNPSTNTATVNAKSTTDLILTYPVNSTLSHQLNGTDTSITLSGSFHSDSPGADALQVSLEHEDHDIHVQNANFTYTLTANGNTTVLVVHKEVDISAIVTGVFKVVNGTVHANLGWKAFRINGQLFLNLEDRTVEINQVGSAFSFGLGDHPSVLNAVLGMFGSGSLWGQSTLDFSALNSPLSTWTRNYDASTNTTTYTKTISGTASLNESASFDGQAYTLSVMWDPSSQIAIRGYATASGDSLSIQPAPAGTGLAGVDPAVWAVAGAVVLVGLGSAFYLFRRSRARTPSSWMSNLSTI
ncbi:MAG TPA: hypothetical protein VKF39_03875 [Nitrososphaerales archaeon]|nr:hypothetical protein [Nitrososphaerales archaeon]